MATECESFVNVVTLNDDITKNYLINSVRKPGEILTYPMWHVQNNDS